MTWMYIALLFGILLVAFLVAVMIAQLQGIADDVAYLKRQHRLSRLQSRSEEHDA